MNSKQWLIALVLLALIGAYTMNREPRGIRNNNPGNIRHGDNWKGMAKDQPDADFIRFTHPEYGIRAMARILKNYRDRYGITTVEGIISRWAPPVENNTQSYVTQVAKALEVEPDQDIELDPDTMFSLVKSMIHHENGKQPYSDETINIGVSLA